MKRIICIIILLLLTGCHNETFMLKKPIDNRQKWKALAIFVKDRHRTDMTVKEIAAELAYQEYLLGLDK